MSGWKSVLRELPERNEQVYAKDDDGRIFTAAYFGPSIGWVNLETYSHALVTAWTRGV